MLSTRLILVLAGSLAALSCTGNPLLSRGSSAIMLSITLPRGEHFSEAGVSLSKAVTITQVTISVTGEDMDNIDEDLAISSDGQTASGTVEVPKGDARTFEVECRDGGGILQYSGSTTQDILEDAETVTITTEGHYPSASVLSVSNFGATFVSLAWSQSTDADFASYELVRAGSETSIGSSATRTSITSITSRNTTTYTDNSVNDNTTYYYAVIVWDTEGLGLRSSAQSVRTPVLDVVQEFSDTGPWVIPDNSWISRFFVDNNFAPFGSVVTNLEYRLRVHDTGDPGTFWAGDYEIYIYSSFTTGFQLDDLVYDNLGTRTDGGFDDDAEDDSDIDLNWRTTNFFNGENPNQYWGVYVSDNILGDSGQLAYIELKIHYTPPSGAAGVAMKRVAAAHGSKVKSPYAQQSEEKADFLDTAAARIGR